jgi:hypothetical protein
MRRDEAERSNGIEVNSVSRVGHLLAGLSRQMVRRARLVEGGDENLRHAPLIIFIFCTLRFVGRGVAPNSGRFLAPKGEKQLRSNTLAAFRGVSSKWLLLTWTHGNEKGFEQSSQSR